MMAAVIVVVAVDEDGTADAALGDRFTVGELIYTVTGDGEVEVADTTSTSISGDLAIPSSIMYGSSDYQVTSLGLKAFSGCSKLTSIEIPDSVTSIGNFTFQNCYALTSINIPDGVTSTGNSTFQNCYALTSINIPDGVTTIGNNTFENCNKLTSIEIPDSVTTIGFHAFDKCYALTSINIPDGVTTIGNYTFGSCGSLTSIEIPDSVTSIGVYAFFACHELTSVVIPINVTSIGFDAFKNCTGLTSVTFKSETAPSIDKDSFDTGTTIYVRTPGWDPEIPFEDAYSLGTNIVWVKFSDLTFESDPVADGIIAYVTNKTS